MHLNNNEDEELVVPVKKVKQHKFFKKQRLNYAINIISILKTDNKYYYQGGPEESNFSHLRSIVEKYSPQVGLSSTCQDWLVEMEALVISFPMIVHKKKKIVKLLAQALESDIQDLIIFALHCMNALCLDFNFSELTSKRYFILLESLISLSQKTFLFYPLIKNSTENNSIQLLETLLFAFVELIRFVPSNSQFSKVISKNISILCSLALSHKEFPVKAICLGLLLELLPLSTESIFNDKNLKRDEFIILSSLILSVKILPDHSLSWLTNTFIHLETISLPTELLVSSYLVLFNWAFGKSILSIPHFQYHLFESLSHMREKSPTIIQLCYHLRNNFTSKDALNVLIPILPKIFQQNLSNCGIMDFVSTKEVFIETFCHFFQFSDDETIPKILGWNFPDSLEIENILFSTIPSHLSNSAIFWQNFFLSFAEATSGQFLSQFSSLKSILANFLAKEFSTFTPSMSLPWSEMVSNSKDNLLFRQAIECSLSNPVTINLVFDIVNTSSDEKILSLLITILEIASELNIFHWIDFESKFIDCDVNSCQLLRLASNFSSSIVIKIFPVIIQKLVRIFYANSSFISFPPETITLLKSIYRIFSQHSIVVNEKNFILTSYILSICAKGKDDILRFEACRIISYIFKLPLLLEAISLSATLTLYRQKLLLFEKFCSYDDICSRNYSDSASFNAIISPIGDDITPNIKIISSVDNTTCTPFLVNEIETSFYDIDSNISNAMTLKRTESSFPLKMLILDALIGSLLWTPFRPFQDGLLLIIRNMLHSSFVPVSIWHIWKSSFIQTCKLASTYDKDNFLKTFIVPLTLLITLITDDKISDKILVKVQEIRILLKGLFISYWNDSFHSFSSSLLLYPELKSFIEKSKIPKLLSKSLCLPLLRLLALIPSFEIDNEMDEILSKILIDECLCIGDSTFQSATIDVLSKIYQKKTIQPMSTNAKLSILISELKILTDTGKGNGAGGEWREALQQILSKADTISLDKHESTFIIYARILISILFGRLSQFSRLNSTFQSVNRKMIISAIVCYLSPDPFWDIFINRASFSFQGIDLSSQSSKDISIQLKFQTATECCSLPRGSQIIGFLNVIDEFASRAGHSLPIELLKKIFSVLFTIIDKSNTVDSEISINSPENNLHNVLLENSPTFTDNIHVDDIEDANGIEETNFLLKKNSKFFDHREINMSNVFFKGELNSIDNSIYQEQASLVIDNYTLQEKDFLENEKNSLITVISPYKLSDSITSHKDLTNRYISYAISLTGKLFSIYLTKLENTFDQNDSIINSPLFIDIILSSKNNKNSDPSYALDIVIALASRLSLGFSSYYFILPLLTTWINSKLMHLPNVPGEYFEKIIKQVILPVLSYSKKFNHKLCFIDDLSLILVECFKKKKSLDLLLKIVFFVDPNTSTFTMIVDLTRSLLEKEALSILRYKHKLKEFNYGTGYWISLAFLLIFKEKGVKFLLIDRPVIAKLAISNLFGVLFSKEIDVTNNDKKLSIFTDSFSTENFKIISFNSDFYLRLLDNQSSSFFIQLVRLFLNQFTNDTFQSTWWLKSAYSMGQSIFAINQSISKQDSLFTSRPYIAIIQDIVTKASTNGHSPMDFNSLSNPSELPNEVIESNEASIILLSSILSWLQQSIIKGLSSCRSDLLNLLSFFIQSIPPIFITKLPTSFQLLYQLLDSFSLTEFCPLAALGDAQFLTRQKGLIKLRSSLTKLFSQEVIRTEEEHSFHLLKEDSKHMDFSNTVYSLEANIKLKEENHQQIVCDHFADNEKNRTVIEKSEKNNLATYFSKTKKKQTNLYQSFKHLITEWVWPLSATALIPESRKRPGFPSGTISAYAGVQESALELWVECALMLTIKDPIYFDFLKDLNGIHSFQSLKKIIIKLVSIITGNSSQKNRSEPWWPMQAFSITSRLAERLLTSYLEGCSIFLREYYVQTTLSKIPCFDTTLLENNQSTISLSQFILSKVGPLCLNYSPIGGDFSESFNKNHDRRPKLAIGLVRFLASFGMPFQSSLIHSLIPGLRSRDSLVRNEIREILFSINHAWNYSITLPSIAHLIHSIITPISAERFLSSEEGFSSHGLKHNSRDRSHHGGFLRHVTSYTLSFLLENISIVKEKSTSNTIKKSVEVEFSKEQDFENTLLIDENSEKSYLKEASKVVDENIEMTSLKIRADETSISDQLFSMLDDITIARLVYIFCEASFGRLAREKMADDWAQKSIEVRTQKASRSFTSLVKLITVSQVIDILLPNFIKFLIVFSSLDKNSKHIQEGNYFQNHLHEEKKFDLPTAKAIFCRIAVALKEHPELLNSNKNFGEVSAILLKYIHNAIWSLVSVSINNVDIQEMNLNLELNSRNQFYTLFQREKDLKVVPKELLPLLGAFGLSLFNSLLNKICDENGSNSWFQSYGSLIYSIIQQGLKKTDSRNNFIDDTMIASCIRLLSRMYVHWKKNNPVSPNVICNSINEHNFQVCEDKPTVLITPKRIMFSTISKVIKLIVKERPEDCSSCLVSASFSLLASSIGEKDLLNDGQLVSLISSTRFTDKNLFIRMLESNTSVSSIGLFFKRFYACRRPLAIPEAYSIAEFLLERLLNSQNESIRSISKDSLLSFLSFYPMSQTRYKFWLDFLIGQLEHPWEESRIAILSLLHGLIIGPDGLSMLKNSEFSSTFDILVLKSLLLYTQNDRNKTIQEQTEKLLFSLLTPTTIPPLLRHCLSWLHSSSEKLDSFIKISIIAILKCQEAIKPSILSKIIGKEQCLNLLSSLRKVETKIQFPNNSKTNHDCALSIEDMYHQTLNILDFPTNSKFLK